MGLELRQEVVDRQKRTIQALNAWKRRQFDYGDADCCQFVAHVIKHMSGKDYSKAFAYNDQEEADQIISRFGSLKGLITAVLGEPSKNLLDGDPVISCFPIIGETMGVKLSDKIVCLTEKGMTKLPNKYQVCGWSICLK